MAKALKILVGVNTLTSMDTEVYGSHSNFWYHNGKMHPDWTFFKYHPRRVSIDRMRNWAAVIALGQECDYLMFIDDDVIIEKDTLDVLLAADKDIVAELTYIRGYPFDPMLFKGIKKEKDWVLEPFCNFRDHVENGIVECDAVGFSCVLIKCELLRKISTPYFVTGQYNTEDIYFCMKVRQEVPEATIYTDVQRPTAHLLDKLCVTDTNVEILRRFYAELSPPVDKTEDRGFEYVERNLVKT